MMMNDFGVPMGDAEMNMQSVKPHEKLMTEAGVEMNSWVGAAIGVGMSLIGGNNQKRAAEKQAKEQNKATERQYKYDLELHSMNQDRLIAEREEAKKAIEVRARNESKIATFNDARNLQKYNYDLKIRDREQLSLNQQYLKSNQIYNQIQSETNPIEGSDASCCF